MRFSLESRTASYVEVSDLEGTVTDECKKREALYEEGKRSLKDFKFDVIDGIPCLTLGPYKLLFSELAFYRFAKLYKTSVAMYRAMGKKGNIGENYIISLTNDLLKERAGNISATVTMLLYKHPDDENTFTIREMLRETDPAPPLESGLSTLLESDPQLEVVSFRLSDFGSMFKTINSDQSNIMHSKDGATYVPRVDVNISTWSKRYNIRAGVRVIHDDSGDCFDITTGTKQQADNQAQVLAIAHKHMALAEAFAKTLVNHEFKDTKDALVVLIRACKRRKIIPSIRREALLYAKNIKAKDSMGLGRAIGKAIEGIDVPDQSNRGELVAHDVFNPEALRTGSTDYKEAELYVDDAVEKFLRENS